MKRALQACLGKGWVDYHGLSCVARLSLAEYNPGLPAHEEVWAKAIDPRHDLKSVPVDVPALLIALQMLFTTY